MDERARSLGIAMVLLGAVLLLGSTAAFDSTDADRTASVSVSSDATAYMAVNGTDAATTPTFTNLFDRAMDLTLDTAEATAEFDVGDTGTYVTPPITRTLQPGETLKVAMKADVQQITVDIAAAVGGGGVDLSRRFDIPQSSAISDIQGSVNQAGQSGKYEFGLENTAGINVTVNGIAIENTTNPDVTEVSGGDILDTNSQGPVVSQPIQVGGPVVDFDQAVTIPSGGTDTWTFDRFQHNQGGFPDMRGENVTVTLRAEDGSTAKLTLEG